MATEEPAMTEQPAAGPPPPSAPPPPPQQPQQSAVDREQQQQQQPPPPVDGKAYYGFLFTKGKTPTPVLDALLRAIGSYIIDHIGDVDEKRLVKTKLAAFYRAVGGDYDALFKEMPDKTISYIYAALGVQHSLQPGDNDFEEPSVPALTLKGFARWESLQILLGPEEHVPFMQHAVQKWHLRNPDTGEMFPADLPAEAFPAECDPEIDAWHRSCGEKLRHRVAPAAAAAAAAAPKEEHSTPRATPAQPHKPRVYFHHVQAPPQAEPGRHAPPMDYFNRPRQVPYINIPRSQAPPPQQAAHQPNRSRTPASSSSNDDRGRRRSFSDYPSPSANAQARPAAQHLHPHRRHNSQPRHYSSSSTDSEDDQPPSPRSRPRDRDRPPVQTARPYPPDAAANRGGYRADLRQDRQDDPPQRRRSSLSGGPNGLRAKIGSLLAGSDRPRSNSRGDKDNGYNGGARSRLGPENPSPLARNNWSSGSLPSEESGSDVSPKHMSRRDRERAREREERERERKSARERYLARPSHDRRTSSTTDVDRRSKEWDSRERERERERDRERDRDRDRDRDRIRDRDWERERDRDRERDRNRDRDRDRGRDVDYRRNLAGDERERERDRSSRSQRGSSPVMVGVGGRKYPTDTF